MYFPQGGSTSRLEQPASKRNTKLSTMDAFIRTQLRPVDECIICTQPFSATHQPVALDCKHIFGHKCIEKWVRVGKGKNDSCPICRHVLVEKKNSRPGFDAPSVWKRLCKLPIERLNEFMKELWKGIREIWQQQPDGQFTVTEFLDKVVFPALIKTGAQAWSGAHDALTDAYNLIAASWDSLGRPDRADGLAIPLIRLTRLMSSASTTATKWLTSLPQANELFWKANECLGLTEEHVSWDFIMEATKPENNRYLPLLHLYTMLISHSIERNPEPKQMPTRRHEIMNLVVERCCTRIGSCYTSKPSNQFKEKLVVVFEELRRYQLEKNRWGLRGHKGESALVKGIWAIAGWVSDGEYSNST